MLNKLAEKFDLVAFDYRGMGASQAATNPYSMADVAADVAQLLNGIGWERTAVAGFSFGGMVAQEFAVTFPGRLERLALLSTSPGGAFGSFPLDTLAALPANERLASTLPLIDQRWSGDWLAGHPADAALVEALGFHPNTPETESQNLGRVLQLQARKSHDVLNRLCQVTCPSFVANGRYDAIAPVSNGQAIVDRIPDAMLNIYEGGHVFFVQDSNAWPDLFAALGA